MSRLDDILSSVGELVQGAYKLKSNFLSSVQVKDWPFYSDPERQLLRRYNHVHVHTDIHSYTHMHARTHTHTHTHIHTYMCNLQ